MSFTFRQNQKVKTLNEANVDLQLKIDSLHLEIRQLKGNLDRYQSSEEDVSEVIDNLSNKNNELRDVLKTHEDNMQELEYRKSQTELWKENTKKAIFQREETYEDLQEANKLKEKFETENTVLKSANKVLSEVNTKVQPIMDENIKLKTQVGNIQDIIELKDETISELKKQLRDNEQERVNLLNTITHFQTKDAQVVNPQVIQPSIIEPVVLSAKK